MWQMMQHSIALFFRGKLFANPRQVMQRLAIGIAVTAGLFVGLAEVRAPLWLAALVAALLGGGLQPYLFKDLRYL